jgi:hypothetical protein
MEFGTRSLADLTASVEGTQAYVRAACDLKEQRWTLRTAYVVIGAKPPNWRAERWPYEHLVLTSSEMRAGSFLTAFDAERGGVLTFGDLHVHVPRASDARWQHKPSRAQHDVSPLPWPTIDYEIDRQDVSGPVSPSEFQIGQDWPSFPDDATAIRAFFHGNFSSVGSPAASTYQLATVRVAQLGAWFHRVRATPTHLDVYTRGDARQGTRVEISGSTLQTWKSVGRSGRVRITLSRGLPDDAWLYLTRGHEWLDYRPLGPRLSGARDLAAGGVAVELASDPEARARALIAQGEGPRIEFKRALPESTPERLRPVLKTVAAFASGDGGDMVFGVDADEATVIGIDAATDLESRDRLGQLIRRYVVPTPEFEAMPVKLDGKALIVLSVRGGQDTPYGLQWHPDRSVEYFVRRGASTFHATQAEVRASVIASLPQPAQSLSPIAGWLPRL